MRTRFSQTNPRQSTTIKRPDESEGAIRRPDPINKSMSFRATLIPHSRNCNCPTDEQAARLDNAFRSRGVECGTVDILICTFAAQRKWDVLANDIGLSRCLQIARSPPGKNSAVPASQPCGRRAGAETKAARAEVAVNFTKRSQRQSTDDHAPDEGWT
jgi:hypothetical protein